MRIRVDHRDVTWLAVDQTEIAIAAKKDTPAVVRRNVTAGRKIAQGFARDKSGSHGKGYFKRITSEMTSPLVGEYGPHAGGTPVGAGYRHGINTDLPRSQDVIGPKFERDVTSAIDGWFASRSRTGR